MTVMTQRAITFAVSLTAGVLLGTPSGLTSTQIILLSMAVSFITVVDDLLSDAFVGRQTLREIERVQALIDQQRAGAAVNHGSDLAYSGGLYLYLLVLVLNIEVRESPFAQATPGLLLRWFAQDFMMEFGDETDHGAVCSDVVAAIQMSPLPCAFESDVGHLLAHFHHQNPLGFFLFALTARTR